MNGKVPAEAPGRNKGNESEDVTPKKKQEDSKMDKNMQDKLKKVVASINEKAKGGREGGRGTSSDDKSGAATPKHNKLEVVKVGGHMPLKSNGKNTPNTASTTSKTPAKGESGGSSSSGSSGSSSGPSDKGGKSGSGPPSKTSKGGAAASPPPKRAIATEDGPASKRQAHTSPYGSPPNSSNYGSSRGPGGPGGGPGGPGGPGGGPGGPGGPNNNPNNSPNNNPNNNGPNRALLHQPPSRPPYQQQHRQPSYRY